MASTKQFITRIVDFIRQRLLRPSSFQPVDGAPKVIAINHDDYHAEYVGRTKNGNQFFVTTPFEPDQDGNGGREFLAVYVFDREGKLLEATIDDLGPRATVDGDKSNSLRDQRLKALDVEKFGRIEVAPFALERFGSTFGLVLRHPETSGDTWAVEVLPGNYMAFFPPWDCGTYDT